MEPDSYGWGAYGAGAYGAINTFPVVLANPDVAISPQSVVAKLKVYDDVGKLVGYIPVYNEITNE